MPPPMQPARRRSGGPAHLVLLASTFALAWLAAASCVPIRSVHALATPADTLFDESLRGRWVSADFDPADSLEVVRAEFDPVAGSPLTDWSRDQCARYGVHLVRLNAHWFVDLQLQSIEPAEEPPPRASQLDSLRSLHLIARVTVDADTLTMTFLDDESVENFAELHPGEVGLTTIPGPEGDETVMTGSTSELRRFVSRAADADSLFGIEVRLVRVR